jgi:hypothetical protein
LDQAFENSSTEGSSLKNLADPGLSFANAFGHPHI